MSISISSISSSRISSIVKVTASRFKVPEEARMVYVSSGTECEVLLPSSFDPYSELTIKRHPKMKDEVNIRSETSSIDLNEGLTLDEESSSVKLRYYDGLWFVV